MIRKQNHLEIYDQEQESENKSEKIVKKLSNDKVEIYSPSMKNKITVKKVKSRIQSKLHKRMELEYIESTIQGM